MKVAFLINKSSGSSDTDEGLKSLIQSRISNTDFESYFIDCCNSDSEKQINDLINDELDILVASGGDGTINSAASKIIDKNISLGILPSGTLNHFAKDLNIPNDIEQAIDVILKGNIIKVDVGEVNGLIFLNNSSIGFYPKVVKKRDKHLERLGGNKWIAMFRSIVNVFKNYKLLKVEIKTEEKFHEVTTPFVFIGNNEYQMNLLNLGKRKSLTNGHLSLYYGKAHGKFSVIWFTFLGLLNKLDQNKDFIIEMTDEVIIDINKKIIEVSRDGEVDHLQSPLVYKIRPKSLSVIVPEVE